MILVPRPLYERVRDQDHDGGGPGERIVGANVDEIVPCGWLQPDAGMIVSESAGPAPRDCRTTRDLERSRLIFRGMLRR